MQHSAIVQITVVVNSQDASLSTILPAAHLHAVPRSGF